MDNEPLVYKSLCYFEDIDILVPLRKDKRGNIYAFNPEYSNNSQEQQNMPDKSAQADFSPDIKQKYAEELQQRATLGRGIFE